MKQILNEINAVLFDLDGTLIDSMWVWENVDIEYLGRYGYEVTTDLQKLVEGMGFSETAKYFKQYFNLPDTVEQIKTEWISMAEDAYRTRVTIKQGVKSFLKEMQERNIPMGICTSNHRHLVTQVSETHRIETYFQTIQTACDVAAGKPSPDIYLKAADVLGMSPESCLVFEDVPMGILAGKNAGMKVCAVADDFSKRDETEKRKLADYYINSFEELLDIGKVLE